MEYINGAIEYIEKESANFNTIYYNPGQFVLGCFYNKNQDGNEKIVIVVNSHPHKDIGKHVTMAIRVSDGKELIPRDGCRPCDNIDGVRIIDVVDWRMR